MVFGEPVTFLWTKDVSAHCPSQATTVSFLIDEHVAAEFLIPAGNEGRQEGKERDLDEHVFGVDSANPSSVVCDGQQQVRMDRQDKERVVGLPGGDCSKHW